MNEREKYYEEYIVARAETWAVHDALVISCIEDLDANEDYQRSVGKERAAWIRYLPFRDA